MFSALERSKMNKMFEFFEKSTTKEIHTGKVFCTIPVRWSYVSIKGWISRNAVFPGQSEGVKVSKIKGCLDLFISKIDCWKILKKLCIYIPIIQNWILSLTVIPTKRNHQIGKIGEILKIDERKERNCATKKFENTAIWPWNFQVWTSFTKVF